MRVSGPMAAWLVVVLLPACSQPARSFFNGDESHPSASDEAENSTAPAPSELQGDWELVAARINDESGFTESAVGKPTGKVACAFNKGVLTKWGGQETEASIHVNATKDPMWIDIAWPDGRKQNGVFKLSQDSLQILLAKGERIESLDPGQHARHYVDYHFKRVARRP